MKIFIFNTHNLWGSHLETELEIIQKHLDINDDVYRFVCTGEFQSCDTNPAHELSKCIKCVDMRVCSKQLLEGKIKELPIFHHKKEIKDRVASTIFSYNSIEDIQNLSIDNYDIGYAVLSSIISLLRDPFPDVAANRHLFDIYIQSSVNVYYSTIEYIKQYKPDIIYVFNGRFAHVKPVLRAAQLHKIKCFVHERGHSKFHYELFEDTIPHDTAYVVNKMYSLWNSADPDKREHIGESFYHERISGKEQGWYSFIEKQERGLLPDSWDASKRNIAIFNSSEDEFASIGPDWKNPLYASQTEGITRLVKDSLAYPEIHFYLRIHPNLTAVDNEDKKVLEKLTFPNLTIIKADSPISSYDLLLNCEKVIAFGSTVGIEAVFWGKPSIQAGKSYYYSMDATYIPSTHEELIKMIYDKLEPKNKIPAMIFGHYFKTYGIRFKTYKPEAFLRGSYKGVYIADYESKKAIFFYKKLADKRFFWRVSKHLKNQFARGKKLFQF